MQWRKFAMICISIGLLSGCAAKRTDTESQKEILEGFSDVGWRVPPVVKAFNADVSCSYLPGIFPLNPLEGDVTEEGDSVEDIGPTVVRPRRMREVEDVVSVLDPDSFSGFPRPVLLVARQAVRQEPSREENDKPLDPLKEELYLQTLEENITKENVP
jgi:hypothetical protein